MTLQQHILRVAILPIANLVFVIGVAGLSPVSAKTPQAECAAECYVLEQLQMGADVSLEAKFPPSSFPSSKRELRGAFVAALLTGGVPNLRIDPHGIVIVGAVVTGMLDLRGKEIPYDVSMHRWTFNEPVDLSNSHFAKGLALIDSKFNGGWVTFDGATVALDFNAGLSVFAPFASFKGMRIGGDFIIMGSSFKDGAIFNNARVAGAFAANGGHFFSKYNWFEEMRVEGDFSAEDCEFSYREGALKEMKSEDSGKSTVSFAGAHFANFSLAGSTTFDKISIIDFTRMQADFISFDGVKSLTPSEVKNQRMTFKMLSPVNGGQLEFLLSPYNAEFYTELEASWRTHGYPDEADKIFVARRRAERRENYKSFWRDGLAWGWSFFQDILVGYGKRLKNLLYWSLGFLVIGTLVFRSEKGMRLKDEKKDAPHYLGRYNAFWYSLDLFLPIIKLGEADVWTPKDDRRWANLYRKVHIIIGSLFVPIGLAAWTGIIK
jgi:hypothetical protein